MTFRIYLATFLGCFFVACSSNEGVPILIHFGPEKVDTLEAMSTQQMIYDFENSVTPPTTFFGEMTEVCATAGCWISVKNPNGEDFRVRFKDHFTIPKNTPVGTKVWLHGFPYSDTISVELQKHFAEDEEKTQVEIDAINKPIIEMNFEADGIVFLRKK